jgi:hypothetical protein
MKDTHPHKPYVKAYVFYGVFTTVLFFLIGIPLLGVARVGCRAFGADPDVLRPYIPYFRSALSAVLGYFVFRAVVRREILPHVPEAEEGNGDAEQHGRPVSPEGAPSAPPNEPSP